MNIPKRWQQVKTDDIKVIESLNKNKNLKEEDFANSLSFGTAGIRGIMAAGEANINEFTIAAAAEAYAMHLSKNVKGSKTKGIVVANDNRINGRLYKDIVIKIFNKHGIKVYAFEDKMMATPLLSFLIRKYKTVGGINITASHNPAEYNGFKVYGSDGSQLIESDAKKIANIMNTLDIFDINYGEKEFIKINEKDVEDYVEKVSSIIINDPKDINIAYSPLHGTGIGVADKIFDKFNIKHFTEEKQGVESGEFKFTKFPNPEDAKSYDRVIKLARKNKSDIALVTDPDADRVGVVAKYKKRWKYIDGNQFAAIYLDYRLSEMKKKNLLSKDAFIVKSMVSTDLVNKIAKKYNVEVVETMVGFKNIADVIKNKKGQFIFAFEESYGMLIDHDIARDKDAFQGLVAAIDLASFLKTQGKTIFSRLMEIYDEFGIHRNIQISKKIDAEATTRFFNTLKKTKKYNGKKVINVIDYRKESIPTNMLLLEFKDGSKIIARPSGTEPKVKVYIQTIGKIKQDLMSVVVNEKKFEVLVEESMESFDEKSFSWKAVFKYSIFLTIMALTIFFVFKVIYSASVTGGDTFEAAKHLFTSNNRFIFLFIFVVSFVGPLISAQQRKRLMNVQGENVKFKHLFISGLMGRFVSWVTPFTVGGDAIGYWYLRRKGFKRGPLASSYLMSTVIYQITLLAISAIMLPMGLTMFHDELINGGVAMKTIIILFIIGIAWDVFATFMILMLTFNKTFQEWIVRTAIKLLEWLPFMRINDPGRMASSYQNGFYDVRIGMRTLWNKKPALIEAFGYELFDKVTSFGSFGLAMMGVYREDLQYGWYWSAMVGSDLSRAANAYSITPGGSGTGEFINITLLNALYKPTLGHPPKTTVAGLDFLDKILYQWPTLILSVMTIGIIIGGEKRKDVHNKRNKNNKIRGVNKESRTTFYRKTSFIYVLFGITYLVLLFTLYR